MKESTTSSTHSRTRTSFNPGIGGIGVGRMAEEVCHLIMYREKLLGLPG